MIILDLQTGESHEYGTNTHDSLVVSEDGRTLNYYNMQNGDGSRFGDYRFIVGDEIERYWNIGGFAKPERKKGKWLPDNNNYYEERFICSVCGRSYKVDTCMGKPMWDFCPCGADMRQGGEQDGRSNQS